MYDVSFSAVGVWRVDVQKPLGARCRRAKTVSRR